MGEGTGRVYGQNGYPGLAPTQLPSHGADEGALAGPRRAGDAYGVAPATSTPQPQQKLSPLGCLVLY